MTIAAVAKTILGPLSDIPFGEGRTYAVGDDMIAIFRLRDGSLRAVSAVCPHKGGPLADGQIDNSVVVCPLHLFAWDLSTGCSQSGQPSIDVYPVRVDDGQIVLGE
ncbi:nitrite reductase [Actinoplanes cyaneus]|uniref:Nitrite reductase n=1 Tax=Actinoplanes cyaneus TaxID=52696 RepID=A0A919IG68_9ACTN|nr:Rieske 2Fe-2S domain-containing protein [Actinoplanes cyaneus]MCW2137694.1 nitrite reductase (NADH) small subunit [Actinoplanes cyaneus]GID65099.1 nitrite reductase [Actinoplanes cyaneus]